jgi:predicted metal-dependent enzyme (double-stranded beta helix superfamily)
MMNVSAIPTHPALRRFIEAIQPLWSQPLTEAVRWSKVAEHMPIMLDDRDLQLRAVDWPDTRAADGKHTNLLFYEDPKHRFVINALVKWPGAVTPVHDHAHTWTTYSVLSGSERVVRYELEEGGSVGAIGKLRETGAYTVIPGFIDLVPPHMPHAETAGDARTVALIVRSERIGVFNHRMWRHATKEHFLSPGPSQVPFLLT